MITVRPIDAAHAADVRLKNDPFPLTGFLRPSYDGSVWRYTIERLPEEQVTTMCFPDEDYDLAAMSEDACFLGAYDGERCVGLALLRRGFFKYMYVDNLMVSAAYRRRGVGRLLIEEAGRLAGSQGFRGLYLLAQDNNLCACEFYLRCGFVIGGLDTRSYTGTSQEGKHDITFYLDL